MLLDRHGTCWRLITFVVFLFRVIENWESALFSSSDGDSWGPSSSWGRGRNVRTINQANRTTAGRPVSSWGTFSPGMWQFLIILRPLIGALTPRLWTTAFRFPARGDLNLLHCGEKFLWSMNHFTSTTGRSFWLLFTSTSPFFFCTDCCCEYILMGGRQILPHSISLPPTHFNVLMIPSVVVVNANKKIMLPATIVISRGFPAAVNSTVEKLLTRCLMILGALRKKNLSATHTSLMNQRHSQSQKYITFMSAFKAFSWCYYPKRLVMSAATRGDH